VDEVFFLQKMLAFSAVASFNNIPQYLYVHRQQDNLLLLNHASSLTRNLSSLSNIYFTSSTNSANSPLNSHAKRQQLHEHLGSKFCLIRMESLQSGIILQKVSRLGCQQNDLGR
jgi:hypothetical protein